MLPNKKIRCFQLSFLLLALSGNYERVLKSYVDDRGMVNYSQLKGNRQDLDSFVSTLGKLNRATYERWNKSGKIAFWINAYNALTLKLIIDNYPIRPSFLRWLRFPRNSIRQLPGAWDKIGFTVMGQKVTLDAIEHKILRRKFSEPRIHLALVCAAKGCPPLRRERFVGERLELQLDDQSCRALSDPRFFKLDRTKKRVYLSSIFKWYGNDFVRTYGTKNGFGSHNEGERAVLNFVSRYVDRSTHDFLLTGNFKVEYLDYDWSLNER